MKMRIKSAEARTLLLALCVTCALNANGTIALVDVTTVNLPDLTTVQGKPTPTSSEALAEKNTAGNPSPSDEWSWLESQVQAADLPKTETEVTSGTDTPFNLSASDIGDYLVAHWGNGAAGGCFFNPNPKGGFYAAFLITGTGPGSVTLATPTF